MDPHFWTIASTLGTWAAVLVALLMPFWLDWRRKSKIQTMLAKELADAFQTVQIHLKNFEQGPDVLAAVQKMEQHSGMKIDASQPAWSAFDAWRRGISLEMWQAFKFEISPQAYACMRPYFDKLKWLHAIDDQPDHVRHPFALGYLRDFQSEYEKTYKKCRYIRVKSV